MPRPFTKLGKGPIFLYNTLLTFLTLFELFWTPAILNDIVNETNRYATTPDHLDRTKGGQGGFHGIGIVYGNEKTSKL